MLAYDTAHRLARELTETEEYRALLQAWNKVCEVEANQTMLEDFQKKQIELNQAHLAGEDIPPEKVAQLQKLMEVMAMNPVIRDYRIAELKILRLMGDIEKILWDAVRPGLAFTEGVE